MRKQSKLNIKIINKLYKLLLIKKYFYQNGHNKIYINWFKLFEQIVNFYSLFKFKYIIKTNIIQTQVIIAENKFVSNMFLFKNYLKLIQQYKWYLLNFRKIFNHLKLVKIYFCKFLAKLPIN